MPGWPDFALCTMSTESILIVFTAFRASSAVRIDPMNGLHSSHQRKKSSLICMPYPAFAFKTRDPARRTKKNDLI
jgi:hypothetical protein